MNRKAVLSQFHRDFPVCMKEYKNCRKNKYYFPVAVLVMARRKANWTGSLRDELKPLDDRVRFNIEEMFGAYVFYRIKGNDRAQVVYIGEAGKLKKVNGKCSYEGRNLLRRLTAKQGCMTRKQYLEGELGSDKLGIVCIAHTGDGNLPGKIEADLMQEYCDRQKKKSGPILPEMNNEF